MPENVLISLNQKSIKAIVYTHGGTAHKLWVCSFFWRAPWWQMHLWVQTLWMRDLSWEQTCSFDSLVLKSSAVEVLIAMILTSLEFSTCNHCSKFLRSWEKSSWLPSSSWRRCTCRITHGQSIRGERGPRPCVLGIPPEAEGQGRGQDAQNGDRRGLGDEQWISTEHGHI